MRRRASRRETLAWGLCLAFGLAAIALAIAYARPAPEARVVSASINAPEGASFRFLSIEAGPVEISPDGRSLAFVARTQDGRNVLFVQALDGLEARPLPGTEGATRPFWSPDGRQLGFFADRQLKKVALDGGSPIPLASTEDARGGSWNRDGVIVFAPRFVGPLHQVSSAGGQVRPVTDLDASRSETTHRYPHFLPDGKHFLYLARSGGNGPENPPVIRVASLESPQGKVLVSAPSNPVYASGHLLFVRDGALTAHPFDAARLEMSGEAVRVVDNVQFDWRFGRAVFSASETGILVYQEGTGQGVTQLTWFDRSGNRLGTVAEPAFYDSPELSPDGTRLAARVLDPNTGMGDIWLWDIVRGLGRRLTFDAEDDSTGNLVSRRTAHSLPEDRTGGLEASREAGERRRGGAGRGSASRIRAVPLQLVGRWPVRSRRRRNRPGAGKADPLDCADQWRREGDPVLPRRQRCDRAPFLSRRPLHRLRRV